MRCARRASRSPSRAQRRSARHGRGRSESRLGLRGSSRSGSDLRKYSQVGRVGQGRRAEGRAVRRESRNPPQGATRSLPEARAGSTGPAANSKTISHPSTHPWSLPLAASARALAHRLALRHTDAHGRTREPERATRTHARTHACTCEPSVRACVRACVLGGGPVRVRPRACVRVARSRSRVRPCASVCLSANL
jgi:hypothetical protein